MPGNTGSVDRAWHAGPDIQHLPTVNALLGEGTVSKGAFWSATIEGVSEKGITRTHAILRAYLSSWDVTHRKQNPCNFYERLEQAGHRLIRDEDGVVDNFVLGYDIHNGPGCQDCGLRWCEHCDPYRPIEECEGDIRSTDWRVSGMPVLDPVSQKRWWILGDRWVNEEDPSQWVFSKDMTPNPDQKPDMLHPAAQALVKHHNLKV
jgi:hypothetical protein